MERGLGAVSAVQEVQATYAIPVIAIANLNDVMGYIESDTRLVAHAEPTRIYRAQYGVAA